MEGSWLYFLGFVFEEIDNINCFIELNMMSKFCKLKNFNFMSYIVIFRKEGGLY